METHQHNLAPSLTGNTPSRILAAARTLFYAEGFESVSTTRLAAEAGVSKSSLYKYYGSMERILQAVLEYEAEQFVMPATTRITTRTEFQNALIKFGAELLSFLNRDEIIKFTQLMFAESSRRNEIGRIFYTAAYQNTLQSLAAIFTIGIQQKFIVSSADPDKLSEQLMSMW